MAEITVDKAGLLEEPCLSCNKAYVEDIWYEWCCDEKECPYKIENKPQEWRGSMSKVSFEIEDDAVIKHTPMPEIGEGIYKSEVVITKEIFQKCYKQWIAPQEERVRKERLWNADK